MALLNISDKNFKDEVLKSDLPVLVDFWAPWCGPCKLVTPVIEEVAKEYVMRLKIVKINVEENQGTPTQYGIMSIPTLIFFKNGKIVEQITGALTRQQLKQKIEEVIS
jgi:thioredoxin 1